MQASERLLLAQEASRLGVSLSDDQLERLGSYVDLVRAWNERVRLVGDRDPGALVRKHIPDCLPLLSILPEKGPVADIGTGGGLPGLVLACARPDLEIWLIESRQRRLSFLHDATARIGLGSARVLGFRAEDLAEDAGFARSAALVTARAVAVDQLLEWGFPLLAPEGRIALMQSRKGSIEQVRSTVATYHASIVKIQEYQLSSGEERRIVLLRRA